MASNYDMDCVGKIKHDSYGCNPCVTRRGSSKNVCNR
jgi:hypothetical protein